MTDFETIKAQINSLAAGHEARADDHARRATGHTDAARRLRELSAMVERHARATAGV